MKTFTAIITISFTAITGAFTVIQFIIGNPFHEPVHPGIVLTVFFLTGAAAIKAAFIRK